MFDTSFEVYTGLFEVCRVIMLRRPWLYVVSVLLTVSGCGNIRVQAFNLLDYIHYFEYLPYRQEGLMNFEDFRTAPNPPMHLRNRKMQIGSLKMDVEDVLADPVWPAKWPYSFEDFKPLDYVFEDVKDVRYHYQSTQSLLENDYIGIIPAVFRLPIRHHYVLPKDKIAWKDHLSQYLFPGASVLELFSCYESLLPANVELGPTVGVGLYDREMRCNAMLDDCIEQDISQDPFLPLADDYFDFVVMPANFQLLQRPQQFFQEVNRVLKPGGRAIIGVKLALWSYFGWKQGRYYVETNYLEDVLALGSFFHYAEGFTKPAAYDLQLPELNPVGQLKDLLWPNPRVDFFACVEAKKRKDSPHGGAAAEARRQAALEAGVPDVEGVRFQPKKQADAETRLPKYVPYY